MRSAALVTAALLAACGGTAGPAADGPDGGTADSSSPDVAAPDVAAPDVAAPDGGVADLAPDAVAMDQVLDAATPDHGQDVVWTDVGLPIPWCPSYGAPEAQGALAPGIVEASGLVVSPRDPEVLWVHNDSGAGAEVFAIDRSGALVATASLVGLTAGDWEDLSAGPCEPGAAERGCLYVGDVGDNLSQRPSVSIHRFTEPEDPSGSLEVQEVTTLHLTYPDGARDCEALVVDGQAQVWLLTKEWGVGVFRLYRAPFEPAAGPVELTFISEHDVTGVPGDFVALVTGADYREDVGRLLVRLYGAALEYRLPQGAGLESLGVAERLVVPSGDEAQGESIAYAPEGGYLHVSEGSAAPLWYVPCEATP